MKHFQFNTVEEIRRAAAEVGASHVGFLDSPQAIREVLSRPVRVGSATVGNSIAIHPMEGCDGDAEGRPSELTWRRYERFARGGAKLIWFEATAVCREGRVNPRQLWIHPQSLGELARLVEMLRRTHREACGSDGDLLIPAQLTHSGRFSWPQRIIAVHNPLVDRKTATPPDQPVIADDELERLEDQFVDAARLALEAGFTAVDVKATHGYLAFELLGARTREGRYGGPLENRARFLRNILGKMRAAFGSRLLLAMRLGCYEGLPYVRDPATGRGVPMEYPLPYPYGFGVDSGNPHSIDLDEVKRAIGWFRDDGVELLSVSLGVPYFNPHIGRPFEKPDEGNYDQPEHPLVGVDRHFRVTAGLQRAFPDVPLLGAGYSWLQQFAVNAAAYNLQAGAARFFGMGRNALANPEFPREALATGALTASRVCKTLSYCSYLMRQKDHPLGQFPTGCPPFDKGGYGAVIKAARETARSGASARDLYLRALQFAGQQVRAIIARDPNFYPMYTHQGRWRHGMPAWTHWCDGFLPGIMWILCSRGDESWRAPAERYTRRLEPRQFDREVHDLGFLFTSTYGRWYGLDRDPALNAVLIQAGRTLALRFREKGAYLRSFVAEDSLFIDIMMNVGIIFYAARETADAQLLDIALRHCLTTRRVLVRGDGSTAHEGLVDLATGEFLRQTTQQGFRGDSCWSRGLAWALYGFGTAYGYARDARFLQTAEACADFYIAGAPADGIAPWDFDAPPESRGLVDTSAAAIAASGLLQLARLSADPAKGAFYEETARRILTSLCERHLALGDPAWEGILKGGVYHIHKGLGVNESVMWGEYFFVEALDRALGGAA
jgi:unsaturated chondroitin disaccharide hydrolase